MLGHGGVAPVPGTAHVGGDALSLMEDLDGAVRDPDPELLFGHGVGHRVIVLGGLDMVIETGAALLPFGVLVGLARQRLQRRLVERLEQLPAGRAEMLCPARVEIVQQLADGLVQFREAEETAISQAGQDPAFDDLDADFHFRFVAWFARPRRHDGGVAMGRHAGVSSVDLGIVQAGLDDAGFEIVRYDLSGHPAEIGEGAAVRADPIGQRLRPGRLGIGVAGGAQGGDEDLGRANLAGEAVDHVRPGAGVIDEQLVAGDMGLAHGRGEPAAPIPVEIAEPAVAVTVAMNGAVFLPQERQGHAGPLQLAMQQQPVGKRPAIGRKHRRRRE